MLTKTEIQNKAILKAAKIKRAKKRKKCGCGSKKRRKTNAENW